jgi:hypothetical protein
MKRELVVDRNVRWEGEYERERRREIPFEKKYTWESREVDKRE